MKRARFGALRNGELPRAWHSCFLLQPPQRCSAGHQALLHDVTATTAVRAVKKGRLHSQATNTPPDCLSSCSPVAKSYPQRNLRAAFPLHTIALLTPYAAARAPGGLRGGGVRASSPARCSSPRSMLFKSGSVLMPASKKETVFPRTQATSFHAHRFMAASVQVYPSDQAGRGVLCPRDTTTLDL